MLIVGGNQSAAGGYNVDNSVRINRPSSDSMSGVTNGTSTNQNKYTVSFWTKRGRLSNGSTLNIMEGYTGSSDTGTGSIFWRTSEALVIGGYNTNWRITNRLFRDVSAWYHIVFSVDTTQATADDRIKVYVNGVEETSFSTKNNPSQNSSTGLNNNSAALNLFRRVLFGVNDNHGDGYFSEFCFIDGSALDPTSFGEFDEDSGIWKPISVSGLTFGTNGFYLQFEDSSALGDDTSGNSNDFTLNNITSVDQSTDTCTNNSATMNPLDNYYTAATISEGNLKIVTQNGGGYAPRTSTFALSQGKWYAEVKYVSRSSGDNFSLIGIKSTQTTNTNYLGQNTNDYGYYSDDGDYYQAGSSNSYGASYDQGDIIGIYLDLDNNKLYFAKNGTIQNSGTGISITDPASTDHGHYFISAGDYGNSVQITYEWNFGSPTFSISSGNTDANGYGNFEYDPSSGTFDGASKDFYAINSKNLAEYG